MEIQAWFKIVGSEGGWDEVSLEGIKNVARVKKAIKKEAVIALNDYDAAHLIIKATYNNDKDPENAVELDPEAELYTVLEQVPSPLGGATKTIRFFIIPPLEFGQKKKRPYEEAVDLAIVTAQQKNRHYGEVVGLEKLVVVSEERLLQMDQQWNNVKINLLRSPPASGKTTFARRFQLYSQSKGRAVRRISMTTVELAHAMDEKSFWKMVTGGTWSDFRDCTVPTDILIDEAQMLYGTAGFFWTAIKDLINNPNPNIRVLLLAMYTDRPGIMGNHYTPIDFPEAWGLEYLRLRRTEYDQLVEEFINFARNTENFELAIPISVRDAVFNSTAGHPQLVRQSLNYLKDSFRRSGFKNDGMLYSLVSHEYFSAIERLRVLDAVWNLEMTNYNIKFLRNVYHNINSESAFPINLQDNQTYDATIKFKRSGLITEALEKGYMQFSAPIIRVILGSKLFTGRISPSPSPPPSPDFDTFLLLSLERMRPSTLRESLSHNSGPRARLLERQWQTAWVNAASTVLPFGNSISPDVGAVYGSPGYLDFYIDGSLQWGVELMREGNKLGEHISRFASNGRYNSVPLVRWAIIDFRHHSTVPKQLESNIWYAMYKDDYETIVVRRQGHKDKAITLCGDRLVSSH